MSEALTAIFPTTTLQTCIVDLMRHSLDLEGAQTLAPRLAPRDSVLRLSSGVRP